MRHIEAFQRLDIFLAETLALVMLLLPDQVLPTLYSEKPYGCKSVCRCWPRYAAPMELIAIFSR
jgi:hypothetical protein